MAGKEEAVRAALETPDEVRQSRTDPHGIAKDASQRAFFVHAQHNGDVYVRLWSTDDIERALPIIRQAHALTSD